MSSSVQGVRILTCFTDTWLPFVEASSSETGLELVATASAEEGEQLLIRRARSAIYAGKRSSS